MRILHIVGTISPAVGDGNRVAKLSSSTGAQTLYWPHSVTGIVDESDLLGANFGKQISVAGLKVWSEDASGNGRYLFQYQINSTRVTTDASGNVLDDIDYRSFGDTVDLQHAAARELSSEQGRWLRPDPYDGSYDLTDPQSFNRYVYANNSPLVYADPSGLDTACIPVHTGSKGGFMAHDTTPEYCGDTINSSPDPDPDLETDPASCSGSCFIDLMDMIAWVSTNDTNNQMGPPLPCQVQTQTALNNALNTSSDYIAPTFQLQGQAPGLRGGNYNYNYFLPGVTQANILAATGGTGRFGGIYAGLHIPQPGGADPITALYGNGVYGDQFGSFVTAHYDSSNPYQDLVSFFEHVINDVILKRGRGGC